MKTSRRFKITVLRPLGLLCLILLILNVTLWSAITTLVHSSDDEDKPPTGARTNAYANSLMARGKVDAYFTSNPELFPVGKIWKGTGRAEAGLGRWYQPTNPSNVNSGEIFVKIKVKPRTIGFPPLTQTWMIPYATSHDQSKSAYGPLFDKFANASGTWLGSNLSRSSDSWVRNPNSYY